DPRARRVAGRYHYGAHRRPVLLMAAHTKAVTAIWMAVLLTLPAAASPDVQIAKSPNSRTERIISLVPAATEMLYAIGAGPRVVGVGSYDSFPAEVAKLPKVGALIDPNVELILSLKPQLV